ncbi:tRNA intron endonuclease [Podospora fimiseda]|uniref:tRNA-intron lyase n=1 Tax=Podospora fimiseda TaxID=252190 RepID=A0AAN7GTL2_9PEZI|nr:tRNA intron endonuclease [Podospora fimiseda]
MEPVIGQPRPPVGPAELLALPNSLASATGPKPIFPSDLFATHAPLTPSKRSAGDDEVLVEAKDYQPPKRQKSVRFSPEVEPEETTPAQPTEIINREIFQLSREEAFFLQFSLGALKVVDRGGVPIPTQRLLDLFRASSRVYHHFRSLGWVPRHGIKFGVDWLLYQRGPAFDHSEFGIVVMPAYTNKLWDEHEHQTPKRSWSWLMGVNRVLSHVLKSLVLVYVDIPPPPVFDEAMKQGGIAAALKNYKVREVMVRRFSVNRNRESK